MPLGPSWQIFLILQCTRPSGVHGPGCTLDGVESSPPTVSRRVKSMPAIRQSVTLPLCKTSAEMKHDLLARNRKITEKLKNNGDQDRHDKYARIDGKVLYAMSQAAADTACRCGAASKGMVINREQGRLCSHLYIVSKQSGLNFVCCCQLCGVQRSHCFASVQCLHHISQHGIASNGCTMTLYAADALKKSFAHTSHGLSPYLCMYTNLILVP